MSGPDYKARRAILTLLKAVAELQKVVVQFELKAKYVDNDPDSEKRLAGVSAKLEAIFDEVLKILDEPD